MKRAMTNCTVGQAPALKYVKEEVTAMLLLDQSSPWLQVFGYMRPFNLSMPLVKRSEVQVSVFFFLIEVSEVG